MMSEAASENSNSLHSKRPRWRPQMSLRTMLVGFAFVLLIVAHYARVRELEKKRDLQDLLYHALEIENRRILETFDAIIPTDPDLIHAIRLKPTEGFSERFRIYYPADKKFVLNYAYSSIPTTGLPKPEGVISIWTGPLDSINDEVRYGISGRNTKIIAINNSQKQQANIDYGPMLGLPALSDPIDGIPYDDSKKVFVQSPGKPFVLLRRRHMRRSISDEPKSGLLIWIEEVPDSNVKSESKASEKKE